MNRVVQNLLSYISSDVFRFGSSLHLRSARASWRLGAAAILLPATAYAWWLYNPIVLLMTTDEQTSLDKTVFSKQSVSDKTDDDTLPVDAEVPAVPLTDDTFRQHPGSGNVNTELQINGRAIPIPSQGTVHKEIFSQDGNTSVDISVMSVMSDTSGTSGTSDTSDTSVSTSVYIEMNTRVESEGAYVNDISYD